MRDVPCMDSLDPCMCIKDLKLQYVRANKEPRRHGCVWLISIDILDGLQLEPDDSPQSQQSQQQQQQQQQASVSRKAAPSLLTPQHLTPGRRKANERAVREGATAGQAAISDGQAAESVWQRRDTMPRLDDGEGRLSLPDSADTVRWQGSRWQNRSLAELPTGAGQQVRNLPLIAQSGLDDGSHTTPPEETQPIEQFVDQKVLQGRHPS